MSATFACRSLAAAALAIAWAATPGLALAADKPAAAVSGGLEEVVVTATRREERLQDVPISISAFGQERLDAQGLHTIDDLTRLTPGVTLWRNGFSSTGNYNDETSDVNIRGVDSTAGTATTGVYIDETPIQGRHLGFGGINAFPQLFDLDRVEVLRGPQGTLFGAGAEGGALRFLAPQPSLTGSTGYVRGDLSTTRRGDPSYEGGAAVGGAIIDDVLGYRVSASYRREGGWVDRANYTRAANDIATPPVYAGTTEKAANWWQTATFRAALKWKPSDAVSVSPSIYYQRIEINDTAAYWPDLSNPDSDVYRNGNRLKNKSTDPFWLAAVRLDWDLGFAQLVSNTSYYARDQSSVSDYSQYLRATWTYFGLLPNTFPPPGAMGYAPFRDVQRNFYQEIRLASSDKASRLSWTTGLFFSHLNENVPENIIDPTLDAEVQAFTAGASSVCSVALPCPGGLIDYIPEQRFVDKQLAAFGEATFRLTDTFKATVGVRFSKIDYTGTAYETGPFIGATVVSAASASENSVTPKLVLAWQPDRDNLFYASASKGFRPGGVNVDVGALCNADLTNLGLPQGSVAGSRVVPTQFSSDSLWSYELGGKNTLLDHRLQLNSSIFYINWKNIQQNVYLPTCGEQFAANLGQAQSRGGDINLVYKASEALTLDLTAAYTDAKLTKSSCAGILIFNGTNCTGTDPVSQLPINALPVVTKGDRLVGAPWTFTAAVEYHFADWQGRKPYLRIDYLHTTAQTALLSIQNGNNAIADPSLPGLPITNNLSLHAGLRFSGFDVALYALNLTDAHPLMFKARDSYVDSVDVLYFERGVRPRQIGVTATYRY